MFYKAITVLLNTIRWLTIPGKEQSQGVVIRLRTCSTLNVEEVEHVNNLIVLTTVQHIYIFDPKANKLLSQEVITNL